MADYYPLIARAVAGLDANATGEQRRALYERARTALIAQLRGVTPPLSESEITRERLTLEEAIRKVEQEAAQRARGGRGDGFVRRGGDALKGAAARSSASGAAAPNERASTRPRRERARVRALPTPERGAHKLQGGAYKFDAAEPLPPPPARGRSQRSVPQHRGAPEPRRKSASVIRNFPIGRALIAGIVFIIAGVVISQWQNIRGLA